MKIFSADQTRELDAYTIKNESIASIDLMERASAKVVDWIFSRSFNRKRFNIFCGPGNNGGDGLAITRLLKEKGYDVEAFIISATNYSSDFQINLERLSSIKSPKQLHSIEDFPQLAKDDVVIDALFGSGLNRPIKGLYSVVVDAINKSNAIVISVDIASGLYCDQHTPIGSVISPAYTLTFQLPKLAMLLPENARFVGEMHVLDIGLNTEFIDNESAQHSYLTSNDISSLLRIRSKYSHKGSFGKALVIAGNYGTIGAAALTSKAAYRTGAGLVYAYIPKCGYSILQTLLPEALTWTDPDENSITTLPKGFETFDAIGIGPGISEEAHMSSVLGNLFRGFKSPMVVDAGALNVISKNPFLLQLIPESSILTPHPKEFERLVGKSENDFNRLGKLVDFSAKIKCYVVLKGANTAIATPDGKIYFNSTGNPGMATGGSGDVLTGILTSLLAQGYKPIEATLLGVYLHGFAGDKASKRTGMAPLLASDIIDGIKDFFLDLENLRTLRS